jgi:murein DD-endopeptidase MepM/ murein hydrolase activator NlpD
LPKSTQDKLAAQGKAGWHISVNHAHLQSISVQPNQEFGPNTLIGTLGNAGNSTGPHLHLEVRMHQNPNETQWARMKSGLVSPAILFLR